MSKTNPQATSRHREIVRAIPWKDGENQDLVTLMRRGKSASEIAAILKKSRSAVLGRMKRIRDRKEP